MASQNESRSATSLLPTVRSAPSAAAAQPTPVPDLAEDLGSREQIDVLRRQIVALQRISSLGVLAGGVFHELNNALTPILNYAKLGLRNPDPAYRERALSRILESAQRAAAVTGGMLGLSRPGRAANRREPVELNRLVEEV